MSTQPIAGNQSFTNVVNHAGQVPNLDVADLEANTAEFENLELSALEANDLTVEGSTTFGEQSTVDFKGPTVTFEVGTKVLLDGTTQLGKNGTLDLTAGGPHCVKWTPGALGINTFDPPVQAASGGGTFAIATMDRSSNAALIQTNGSSSPQIPANAISSQQAGTANPVEFSISGQDVYVTLKTVGNTAQFEITSSAIVERNQSGTAGIQFTLNNTPGKDVTSGSITPSPDQQSSNFDGTWTLTQSGTLTTAASTGAKQLLCTSVVSAAPPGIWIQGPDACVVTTSSRMHIRQIA